MKKIAMDAVKIAEYAEEEQQLEEELKTEYGNEDGDFEGESDIMPEDPEKSYILPKYEDNRKDSNEYIPNIYEYLVKEHKRVINWIYSLAFTPTNREKFRSLTAYYMNAEDLIQETYERILRTFYDNEQRKPQCEACKHQCDEFLDRSIRKNTEKYLGEDKCRPYRHYMYTEAMLHNYVNRSLKQNIDIKLKKLTDKNGCKVFVRLEDPIGSGDGEDTNCLGDMMRAPIKYNTGIDLNECKKLLGKKLVFITKLANFELDRDFLDPTPEKLELPNDHYDEATEKRKAQRRKFYEENDLEIPENLIAEPESFISYIEPNPKTQWRELMDRFDFIHSKPKSKDCKLEDIVSDDEIIESCVENGEDLSDVLESKECAELDMLECLPSKEELDSYSEELKKSYLEYLYFGDDVDTQMKYEPKDTEVKIVDMNDTIIPLPLCTYAEVSVQEFLDICAEFRNTEIKGCEQEHFDRVSFNPKAKSTFREFWVSFDMKKYSIEEIRDQWRSSDRYYREAKRVTTFLRRWGAKSFNDQMADELVGSFRCNQSLYDKMSDKFRKYVCEVLEDSVKTAGYETYLKPCKISIPNRRRLIRSEAERQRIAMDRARAQHELYCKCMNNDTHDIDASKTNTILGNLSLEERYKYELTQVRAQEMIYVKDKKVEVICTGQIGNN